MSTETGMDRAIDLLEDLSYAIDYSIIGPNDNRVHETRTREYPYNTICHLETDLGRGTGVLIGPRTILTAGHCLYSHRYRRAPSRISVTPGRSDRNTRPFGTMITSRSYVPVRYINSPTVLPPNPPHPDRQKFDYGVITLPHAFRSINRFMTPKAFTNTDMQRIRHERLITIAGYPGDKPLGTLWRHSERITGTTPTRISYTVDTCAGHSGSPIWFFCPRERRNFIVGVHTSAATDELNRPFTCARGFAPAGTSNSGVRITSNILADILRPNRTGRMRALR